MTGSSVCSLQMIRAMKLKRIHFFINPILWGGMGTGCCFMLEAAARRLMPVCCLNRRMSRRRVGYLLPMYAVFRGSLKLCETFTKSPSLAHFFAMRFSNA